MWSRCMHTHSVTTWQGKVVWDEGTVGHESFLFYTTKTNLYCIDVTYRKLQLLCEHARAPKATHQDQVVPEGHRQGKSKRCNCKFRVTISWPVRPIVGPDGNIRPDLPYISSLRTSHNHDLHPDFDTRWSVLTKWTDKCFRHFGKLSCSEINLISQYAVADSTMTRTSIINVLYAKRLHP